MTVRAPEPRGCPRERVREAGFVLVGVIIFVLALTIIGLSLFSLSSYEAQFLQRSLDGEQAFQSALGGLERARFVLELWGSHLQDVRHGAPPGTSAVAWQVEGGVTDSTGPVDWDAGNPVFIRVTAEAGGARRAVEAWFTPLSAQDYYRQLVTTGGGIEVRSVGIAPATSRAGTVLLDGPVWESSGQDTTAWKQWLAYPRPTPVQTAPDVPVPDVGAFVATPHENSATLAISRTTEDPFITTYQLGGGTNEPLYVTSDDAGNPSWSLYEGLSVDFNEIQVSGCVVWLLPRGVKFYQPVAIRQGTGAAGPGGLVIVAGMNGPAPDPNPVPGLDSVGIWFNGGLQANVPVVLVSDGRVVIWHDNNYLGSGDASELSIFARAVSLMGPESPYGVALHHPPQGPLNNRFLPMLMGHGALPNVTSASGRRLAQRPGTWRASTP